MDAVGGLVQVFDHPGICSGLVQHEPHHYQMEGCLLRPSYARFASNSGAPTIQVFATESKLSVVTQDLRARSLT